MVRLVKGAYWDGEIKHHRDLLAYLVRRLLENGANSSFVSQITDRDVPIETIIADPFEEDDDSNFVQSSEIFKPRVNSKGWNLQEAKPQLAKRIFARGAAHNILNPANGEDIVGTVKYATERQVEAAFKAAKPWTIPVSKRAEILRRALRYYADQAELHSGEPRGIIVTIAPWNFPLAIFLGQIAAALAAGNAVLAKPAEATCLIASVAVDILHEAGVPKTALQNLPGEGAVIGATLASNNSASGVVFTGSTQTAQIINKNVADNLAPSAPLVAETGGINCMIVDSTALPQQAVTDIIASAFQSAGQRCSALRLLYLQDDIYDAVLEMWAFHSADTYRSEWAIRHERGGVWPHFACRKI